MADNLVALDHYAFRGNIPNSSFMKNGYAVWRYGLGEHKGRPNPFAVKQGKTYTDRMFDLRSTHNLASYKKFIDYLQAVQLGQAMKEQVLIESLISKKKKAGEYTKNVQAAEQANEQGKYGLAYTFLLQSEEDFEQLQEDYQKKRFSLSHANEFWKAEYATFVKKRLEEWFNALDEGDIDLDLTPEQLVDEWIASLTNGSDGITALSLEHLRKEVLDKTIGFFEQEGIKTRYKKLNPNTFKKVMAKKYGKTAKGRNRKLSTQINMFTKELGQAAARGMGQELIQTLNQGKQGLAFNTGALTKKIVKEISGDSSEIKIKNDVISYVATEIDIFPQEIIDNLNAAAEQELSEVLENLEKDLENIKQNSTNRIFRVVTNVKGYQSNRDLQIAGEGNFLQRVKNLKDVAGSMPENSVEKLLFMLANTMEGCIADDRIEELSDYIAAVAVAGMWDDYSGLLSLSGTKGKIEEIRMFSSGGVYYSASQILSQTLNNLITKAGKENRQFVSVNITTPKFNADTMYDQLRANTPIEPGTAFEKQQNILATRWQAMRDKVMQQGTMSIAFNQKKLEEINGNLEIFLGNKG